VQLQYENVYPKGQGDSDNQRPDKWSSTVIGLRTVVFWDASAKQRIAGYTL